MRDSVTRFSKALLKTLWFFSMPKTPFDLVGYYPCTTLATAYCSIGHNPQWLHLIGLSLLWDFAMGMWLMFRSLAMPRQNLLNFLVRLRDCSYHPIAFSQFLPTEARPRLEQSSLLDYLRRQGITAWNHAEDVQIYRVEMGPSHRVPTGLCTYNLPFIGAYCFVRDDPEESTVRERFYLFHEVGHTLGNEFARQSMGRKGITAPSVTLLIALLLIQWTWPAFAIVCATVVGLLALRRCFSRLASTFDDEMQADAFALHLMSPEDLEQLRGTGKYDLPDSQALSPFERELRTARLKNSIAKGQAESPDTLSRMMEFVWDSQLAALNLGGWFVILALHLRGPRPHELTYFAWSSVVLIVLALLRYAMDYWRGILIELILMGSSTWRDGAFTFLWRARS